MAAGVLLALAATIFFGFVPSWVGEARNPVFEPDAAPLDDAAHGRHASLLVADMHADSLLWDRDLSERGTWGHIDLPRMREGNLRLQGFTVVTKVPSGMSYESNTGDSDSITALMFGQLRPVATWSSLEARAIDQAAALTGLEAADPKFTIIRTKSDLAAFVDAQASDPEAVAGWLGIEGAHCLEGDLEAVDRLFAAGYRMIAPTHFFDNEVGGSAHGVDKGGLTEFGRKVIARQEALGIAVDVSHGSAELIDDVLEVSTKPVLNSHTGVKGSCDSPRNLTDEQLRGIAKSGGVVGIAFFEEAVCGRTVDDIVKAIQHAVKVAGIDHVGFGSDFDGAVGTPFDATQIGRLTEALREAGFDDTEVAKIAGGNVVRALGQTLPD